MRIICLPLLVIASWTGCGQACAVEEGEWPQLFGQDGAALGVAEPILAGQRLRLQPVWRSSTPVPQGRGSDARKAGSNASEPASAGFASPIIGGGLVYQFTYRPAGGMVSVNCLEKMKLSPSEGAAQVTALLKADPDPLVITGPAKWQCESDDIITAYDQKTGRQKWRRVFPLGGLNWNFFSKGGPALTPAYHQGRIYAVGTGGKVYCLDAQTGEPVWQGDIGARHRAMEELRQEARTHRRGALFNRDFLGSVTAVDGVVLVNDQMFHKVVKPSEATDNWSFHYEVRNGYRAFDAASGRVLWDRPNAAGDQQPAVWRAPDGVAYAITADDKNPVACLDLRTGRELWRLPHGHDAKTWSPMAVGSWMLVAETKPENAPKGTIANLMCYRISPTGASLAWSLKGPAAATVGNPVIVGDVVYIFAKTDGAVIARDAAIGKELGRVTWAPLNGEHDNAFLIAHGGKLFGSQGRDTDDFLVCNLDPARMGQPQVLEVDSTIGYLCPLLPAFTGTTMIVRTSTNLTAFSLR